MFNCHIHQCVSFARLVLLLVLCCIVDHVSTAENPSLTDGQRQLQMENVEGSAPHGLQKRTWKNLQGGWGKRNSDAGSSESEPDYYGSYPAGPSVGDETNTPDVSNSELDRLNRYLIRGLINQRLTQLDTQYDGSDEESAVEKRAWNKINGGWGKRVNGGPAQWNKLGGAWGKREPGWNNLKGLWGKRSAQWNKLSSSWGKRDSGNSNSY